MGGMTWEKEMSELQRAHTTAMQDLAVLQDGFTQEKL